MHCSECGEAIEPNEEGLCDRCLQDLLAYAPPTREVPVEKS